MKATVKWLVLCVNSSIQLYSRDSFILDKNNIVATYHEHMQLADNGILVYITTSDAFDLSAPARGSTILSKCIWQF